ncbi:MAG TPA: methyl-accepting chemotaxis protein [Candidatus Methylomirabilis sp.]
MEPLSRRRKLFVSWLQVRLLLVLLGHAVLVMATLVVMIFLPLIFRLESETLPPGERYWAASQFLMLDSWIWLPLILVFAMMCVLSMVVTHRVAGPLIRFRRVFEAVRAGDLTVRTNIRRFDYLQTEARILSEMVVGLRERVAALRQQREECEAAWREYRRIAEARGPAEIRPHLEAFEARLKQAGASLDQFTV